MHIFIFLLHKKCILQITFPFLGTYGVSSCDTSPLLYVLMGKSTRGGSVRAVSTAELFTAAGQEPEAGGRSKTVEELYIFCTLCCRTSRAQYIYMILKGTGLNYRL